MTQLKLWSFKRNRELPLSSKDYDKEEDAYSYARNLVYRYYTYYGQDIVARLFTEKSETYIELLPFTKKNGKIRTKKRVLKVKNNDLLKEINLKEEEENMEEKTEKSTERKTKKKGVNMTTRLVDYFKGLKAGDKVGGSAIASGVGHVQIPSVALNDLLTKYPAILKKEKQGKNVFVEVVGDPSSLS